MRLRIPASLSLGIFLLVGINLQPAAPAPAEKGKEHKADVIVYGGTAGGVVAAVAVAREGKSVILAEPGKHIGLRGWAYFPSPRSTGRCRGISALKSPRLTHLTRLLRSTSAMATVPQSLARAMVCPPWS